MVRCTHFFFCSRMDHGASGMGMPCPRGRYNCWRRLIIIIVRQGFLHSSYEVPDVACRIHTSPENFYKTLDVTALSIYSAPEVKDLTPKQRGCRFLSESNLKISPVYTYNMCRIQCRMNQANKLCGCVPFYYKPIGKCTLWFYFILNLIYSDTR